jgi:integrase
MCSKQKYAKLSEDDTTDDRPISIPVQASATVVQVLSDDQNDNHEHITSNEQILIEQNNIQNNEEEVVEKPDECLVVNMKEYEVDGNDKADKDDLSNNVEEPDEEEEEELRHSRKTTKQWSSLSNSENFLESSLAKFWSHLQRPEGGMKRTEADADEVANRMLRLMTILSEISGRRLDLDVLRECNEIWDNFMANKTGAAGKLKMRTKYKYVLAIERFLTFILKCRNNIHILYETEKDLLHTLAAIPGWKTALKPDLKRERADKQTDKFETQLTIPEVQAMLKSEAAQADKEFMMKCNESSVLSLYDHNQARDYLIFMMIHSNAQRSGVATGLLVSEFKKATWRHVDERYVLLVKNHKTALEGPAPIVMTKELYQLMTKYYNIFRPSAVAENNGQDCGCFFLTRTGDQLHSSRISSIFNTLGQRYGRTGKGRLFPTKFRQTASTSVAKESQQQREDLSKLMTHKESTARAYYVLEDNIERSVNAQKELSKKCMPTNENSIGRPVAIDEDMDEEIKKAFSYEVKQRSSISIKDVEKKMKQIPSLKDQDSEKVVKRLRYLCTLEPIPKLPTQSETLDDKLEQWDASSEHSAASIQTNTIPPTESLDLKGTSKKKKYWDQKHEDTLKRVCASFF